MRSYRYNLNQIPQDYIVEATNRFKGLALIDKVSEELWMEVPDIARQAVIKTIPKKNKCQKEKQLSEESLKMAVKRREMKSKDEKERYTHLNVEFQKTARRNNKGFLSDQCKEIEENLEQERQEIS